METKETVETMETIGETCKYKLVWQHRERPKQTKENVETGDTSTERARPKDTKETLETVETSEDTCKYNIACRDCGHGRYMYMQIQNCMERQRETKGD